MTELVLLCAIVACLLPLPTIAADVPPEGQARVYGAGPSPMAPFAPSAPSYPDWQVSGGMAAKGRLLAQPIISGEAHLPKPLLDGKGDAVTLPRLVRVTLHQGRTAPDSLDEGRVVATPSSTRGTLHLDVLEGETGFLRVGQAVQAPQSVWIDPRYPSIAAPSMSYAEAARGFLVRAQIRGDRFVLRMAASGNRFGRRGDRSIDIFESGSILSGPVGRWVSLGGVAVDQGSPAEGGGRRIGTSDSRYPAFWIKVEEIDPAGNPVAP